MRAAAASALRAAGYWNSGQECGAACRVLVHESVADEFVELVVQLWESWERDAVLRDRENGVFADPAKVHHIGHRGEHSSIVSST